jgi:hypothetical protein
MTMPSTVNILGFKYKIRYPYQFIERTDLSGQHISLTHELRISDHSEGGDSYDAIYVNEVFMHECIHAIGCITGQEIPEPVIESIAHGFVQIMKDNPELVKHLTEATP